MFLLRVNRRQLDHNIRIYTSNYNQLVGTHFISLCFSFIHLPEDTEIEGKKSDKFSPCFCATLLKIREIHIKFVLLRLTVVIPFTKVFYIK